MSDEQEFEKLKMEIFDRYTIYLSALKQTSFTNLSDVRKRISLINTYSEALAKNASLRTFILTVEENEKVNSTSIL